MPRRKTKPPTPRPQAERRARSERAGSSTPRPGSSRTRASARTTLAQIGAKAGYSRGLVNERFGSKGELVRVLADEFQTYFAHDQLEPALADKHGLEALLVTDRHLPRRGRAAAAHLGRAYYELLGESIGLVPGDPRRPSSRPTARCASGVERTVRSAVRAGEMPRDVDVQGVRGVHRGPAARCRPAVAARAVATSTCARRARGDPAHARARVRAPKGGRMGEVLGIGTTHVPYLMSAPENLLRFRKMLCGLGRVALGQALRRPARGRSRRWAADPEAVAREHHRAALGGVRRPAPAHRRDRARRDPPDRRRPGAGLPARQPAAVRDLRRGARSTRRRST